MDERAKPLGDFKIAFARVIAFLPLEQVVLS